MKYRTIVADPPWDYPEGFALGPGHGVLEVRPLPYPSMTLDEIKGLNVESLADGDARLFLWTTNRYLRDAFDVLGGWGFGYKQTLVWHKLGVNLPAHIAPNAAEFILVGIRGKPERKGTLPDAVFPIARRGGAFDQARVLSRLHRAGIAGAVPRAIRETEPLRLGHVGERVHDPR